MSYQNLPRVTLEQLEADIVKIINEVRNGNSVVITQDGKEVVLCRYSREEELASMPKWKDLEHG